MDLERGALRRRTRLLSRTFAKHDEGKRVPVRAWPKLGLRVTRHDPLRLLEQIVVDLMRSGAAKPIGRVSGIRLRAMKYGVPEAAFGSMQFLRDTMGFLETRKIQPQSGERGIRRIGNVNKLPRAALRQHASGFHQKTPVGDKRDQPIAFAIEREQFPHGGTVRFGIEWQVPIFADGCEAGWTPGSALNRRAGP